MDSSSSISEADVPGSGYTNWELVIKFMLKIVESFVIGPDDSRVSVVLFADQAYVSFYLGAKMDESDVIEAIQNLTLIGGGTNTAAAMALTVEGI